MEIESFKLSLMTLESNDTFIAKTMVSIKSENLKDKIVLSDILSDMLHEAVLNTSVDYTHIGFFINIKDGEELSSSISIEDFNILSNNSDSCFKDMLDVMFTRQTIKALEN